MKEVALAVAARLKPPSADADPEVVMVWRWFVALTTGVTTLALSAHIALACGLLVSTTGYSGFAKASDVPIVVAKVLSDRRVQELPGLLLDAKQKQCAAGGEAKRLYLRAYNDLRAEYYRLTSREFPDPPCADFG